MRRLRILQTACTLASILMMLAACTQDELTDDNLQDLPEGKYPLQISSVQVVNSPQTRVVESADGNNSSWSWDGTEKIGVKFYDETVIYTLKSGKMLEADKTPYWKNKNPLSVTAWYPATDGPLDLSNQSTGLKYAMTGSGTGTYNTPVSLSFTHRLAKVCVELTGDAETVKKVTSIGVKGYKKCTVNNGQVSGGTEIGYILMRKPVVPNGKYWEANLAPQAISKNDFLQINGQVIEVKTKATELVEGNSYVFKIDVSDGTLKPVDGKFTVNADDDVTIKNYNGPASIEVKGEGTATITIDNVQLTTEGTVMTVEKGMTVELKVVGTNNTFTSSNDGGGIVLKGNGAQGGGGATITITGDGKEAPKLSVKASGNYNVGIGANGSGGCGDIKIQNIALEVTSSTSGPAIGVGNIHNSWSQTCGNITIIGSNVTAQSYGGACIGTGCLSLQYDLDDQKTTVGTITIENSTINAKVNGNGWKNEYSACIGVGYFENVKRFCTIKGIVIMGTELNLTTGSGAYKVGTGGGNSGYKDKVTITDGIKVGNTTAKIGWNSDTDYN